ncbi:hypothetical protein EV189_0442 [Motilibacter rhizosphaerae]|uniref:MFS transporter n=1 Tax=Motilibacter rhizosphaerae TaxID=598652 RepID=A0A4Q7NWC6_9ACTN|nr:MFS transporter [Motilibacter rhizosphaerae]RZS91208.1 hypothetical protein EV189_0442 [Motilibacter rhizosphaerae]
MPRPGSFVGDLLDVLEAAGFRRLYANRLLAQAADGMTTVALTSYVFFSPERQATAGDVAAAFAATLLPYSLAGPFAGVLLDRWRRQRILVLASLLKAVLVLALGVLVALGDAGPGFFAVGLLVLSVNRFYLSALSAALPHVVPGRELVMANSVSTTSGTASGLVGAGVAFGLRAALGDDASTSTAVLVVAALTSCSAAAVATRIGPAELGPDDAAAPPPLRRALAVVARGMVGGAVHVARCRPAARALSAIAAHRLVYGLWTVATLLVYRNTLHDPRDTDAALAGLAQVVAASGVGYFLAAVLTPEATLRIRKSTWVACLLGLAALTQAVGAVAPVRHVPIVVEALVLGVCAQGVKICVDTIVQESVEDAYRGRVFALYDTVFNVTFVAAAALAAVLVPASGTSGALRWGLSGGYLVVTAAYATAVARRPLSAEGRVAAAA